MSAREADRAGVPAWVGAGELCLREGAELLEPSYWQAKRRLALSQEPPVVHRAVGRPSNRTRSAPLRTRVVELVRSEAEAA